MTRGELLEFLTARAKEFRKCESFIYKNEHLTGITEDSMPMRFQIDGVLVAFINYVGMSQCIDYALDVNDVCKE